MYLTLILLYSIFFRFNISQPSQPLAGITHVHIESLEQVYSDMYSTLDEMFHEPQFQSTNARNESESANIRNIPLDKAEETFNAAEILLSLKGN